MTKTDPEMHLVVTFMDNELGFYPLIRGYRIDRSSNTILVLGYQTEPPIRIPLCNVRSWTTEKCNEATDGQAAARYSESTVPAQA